jgi:hypothetical protein
MGEDAITCSLTSEEFTVEDNSTVTDLVSAPHIRACAVQPPHLVPSEWTPVSSNNWFVFLKTRTLDHWISELIYIKQHTYFALQS